MSLEELNDSLHSRDTHLDRARQAASYEPEGRGGNSTLDKKVEDFRHTETWQAVDEETSGVSSPVITLADKASHHRRKQWLFFVGGLTLLLLVGGLIYKLRLPVFNEEKVDIQISGPRDVASAELTTFTFTFTNNNPIVLNKAVLTINYPETFHPEASAVKPNATWVEIPLSTLAIHSQNKVTLSGKFYGSKGDQVIMRATLRYTPDKVTSALEKETRITVNIASSPLSLEIEAPQELTTGQNVDYVISYNNTGDVSFSNLRIEAVYPAGFEFLGADPRATDGNSIWHIDEIAPRSAGKIVVHGTLIGIRDERKSVSAKIGLLQGDGNFLSYSDNERKTAIVASPLSITQTINGQTDANVGLGDVLDYVVQYKNEGDIGLRGAVVTVEINSPYLDFTKLSLNPKGSYDQARNMMTWKASDVADLKRLEPGQGGSVSFSLPIVSVVGNNQKNERAPVIRSVARIDSPDVPSSLGSNKIIASNIILAKVNTSVDVGLTGFYDDATFPNTGPFPPTVGLETSYTFHLTLHNTSSDIANAQVNVSLPSGVRYTGQFSPAREKIHFDSQTNELTWNVETLTAGSSRELVFQVAETPSLIDVGKDLQLVKLFVLSGQDTATGKAIRLEKTGRTSSMLKDPRISNSGGAVQPATN